MKTDNILDYDVSIESLEGNLDAARELLNTGKSGQYVTCLNPHSYIVARKDVAFRNALQESDILLPDGIGIVLASNILNKGVQERVTGSDFFLGLTRQLQERGGGRYFFLGSTTKVLELISEKLNREYPAIEVVGILSPPFRESFTESENREIIARINTSRPDVLWVGMTAPRQEKWIHANRQRLEVPLIGAIGAVFDFYSGTRKRSPEWLCRIGLEWLPRFLREPRRLYRRNLVSSPLFILAVLREKRRRSDGNKPVRQTDRRG